MILLGLDIFRKLFVKICPFKKNHFVIKRCFVRQNPGEWRWRIVDVCNMKVFINISTSVYNRAVNAPEQRTESLQMRADKYKLQQRKDETFTVLTYTTVHLQNSFNYQRRTTTKTRVEKLFWAFKEEQKMRITVCKHLASLVCHRNVCFSLNMEDKDVSRVPNITQKE